MANVLVTCEGTVAFTTIGTAGENRKERFSESFLLVKQDELWKIVSDCVRFL